MSARERRDPAARKPDIRGGPGAIRHLAPLGERVCWLIRLRWLAVGALFGIVTISVRVFHAQLEVRELYLIGATLALVNLAFFIISKVLRIAHDGGTKRAAVFAEVQILADLLVLAALIHYSGGVENPFAFYFVFHIIVSGTLLSPREAWGEAALATLLFCGMVKLEQVGAIAHHHVPGLAPPDLYRNSLFVTAVIAAFSSTIFLSLFTAISITQLVRAQQQESAALIEQLRQAYGKLGELEQSKSRYMRKVSHELRAPLGAIQNLLAMVEEALTGEGESNQRRLVGRANERLNQALKLVTDLLILARAQDAGVTMTMKDISLSKVITDVAASLRIRAEKKEVALTADVPPDLPRILGDAESMEQLVTNLVANAVKYTPKGGRVNVEAAARDKHIVLRVTDTGIGIPAEDLPSIFDEFYRAGNAREYQEQGTGLGLSIVKSIADMHAAEIRVQSEVGRGTTFEVTFPRAPSA